MNPVSGLGLPPLNVGDRPAFKLYIVMLRLLFDASQPVMLLIYDIYIINSMAQPSS